MILNLYKLTQIDKTNSKILFTVIVAAPNEQEALRHNIGHICRWINKFNCFTYLNNENAEVLVEFLEKAPEGMKEGCITDKFEAPL